MSDPFIGEIRMFAGNFAPRGWSICSGQLLSISQNDALFSLLGTMYGGDGRTTFGLPDLAGRVPLHYGEGPGLSSRRLGEKGGQEAVSLSIGEIPPHTHALRATSAEASDGSPSENLLAKSTAGTDMYAPADQNNLQMNGVAVSNTGSNTKHANIAPFLCVNFIISLFGLYPSRS